MQRIVITAVLAASFAGAALAESPLAVPVEPFVSSKTRAQVQAELAEYQKPGINPWSTSYNPLKYFRSTKTRAGGHCRVPRLARRSARLHKRRQRLRVAARRGAARVRHPFAGVQLSDARRTCLRGDRPQRASGAHCPRVVLRRAVGTALLRASADRDASHPAWACARAPLAHAERRGRLPAGSRQRCRRHRRRRRSQSHQVHCGDAFGFGVLPSGRDGAHATHVAVPHEVPSPDAGWIGSSRGDGLAVLFHDRVAGP